MTNKERLEANNEKIKAIQETLKNKVVAVNKDLLGVFDGTLEEFDNKKVGVARLAAQRFYGFTNLKKADFTGITEIPAQTCYGCTSLIDLTIDENVTKIGNNAFELCNKVENFVLRTNEFCSVGSMAFSRCPLIELVGNFSSIGSQAFEKNDNIAATLKTIDIKVNGAIGSSAFSKQVLVNVLKIDKESVITSIGTTAFRSVGERRPNPETNIFDLDFSNSTFTDVNSCFDGGSSTQKCKYYTIQFPSTVKGVGNYAFRYSDNMTLYFKSLTPPNLNSSAFTSATNYKIFVPYNLVNAYKTATNWSAQASHINGFADKDLFKQGQTLPKYSTDGFELTWYSDKELTTQVTTAENPSEFYYCTIGAEQIEVVGINSIYEENCNIVISDSTSGYVYSKNEGIPVGIPLTITATPSISGYIPYIFTLNNEDITSLYSYTTVSDTNINLVGIYYNGVDLPIDTDFNSNHWAVIKKVVQSGTAGQYWSVGDIKEIEINGRTYGIRLADLQSGRYTYANGTRTTNAVLEFVHLWNQTYRMNATGTTTGGWDESEMKTTLNTTILEQIPYELRNILEEITINCANGGGSYYTEVITSNNKLFLPAVVEISTRNEYTEEGTLWDYYINATNATRKKTLPNSTTGQQWWLRTPQGTSTFYNIESSGSTNYYNAAQAKYVCPCFAW